MKHAAVQAKSTVNSAPSEKTISIRTAGKEQKIEAVLLPAIVKTKASKKVEPTIQKANVEAKAVKTALVSAAPKPKRQSNKIAVSADGDKKTAAKENVSLAAKIKSVAVKNVTPKVKKVVSSAVSTELQIENKETASSVSLPVKKAVKGAPPAVQTIETPFKKSDTNAPLADFSNGVHKIKSAVNVGRINAALKAIEAAQMRAAQVEKSEKRGKKRAAKPSKVEILETKIETAMLAKTKPKNVKQIGAAVFRGRKNRYDFQVYPLDFEFENVSAIYVISRRKTDSKKRAHHAFVCIGQTDSLPGELAKHTRSKCVKRHEANVVSILTEPSEKKRLKIEEDLRAAHAIVCNIAREEVADSELSLV